MKRFTFVILMLTAVMTFSQWISNSAVAADKNDTPAIDTLQYRIMPMPYGA